MYAFMLSWLTPNYSIPTGQRSRFPPHHPLRVVALDDGVQANNAWPSRFSQLDPPPPPSPPSPPSPPRFRWFMHRQDDPHSSGNESKLTTDEQHRVLSKLRKEFYNPATRNLPNLYFRDKNKNCTTLGISKEKDENWKRCAICLEDFEAREEVTITPCSHMFHEECIVPWVKNQGLCPVCRFAICERLNQNSVTPARATGAPPPPRRRLAPPPPPPVDRDMLAIMRALVLDDDHELQSMIPVLLGR